MTIRILLSLLFAIVLAGCGQSGPLYIPGDPSSVEAPEETEEDEENGEDDSG